MTIVIIQFAIATLLPVAATAVLLSLRKTHAKEMGHKSWQLLCGLVFGAIAIFGTEFGIATHDATMNVRDAAPIVAGLFFGTPAGIIAGVIGGVERWFAALWGKGMFTRVACSLGTCLAGLYASLMRKYVFEDRRPNWMLGCEVGAVAEVLHLMLVFITNGDAPEQAFIVVRACTIPMIACNALSVGLAAIVAARQSGEMVADSDKIPSITRVIQNHLSAVVVVGFIQSMLFTLALQGGVSRAETGRLLSIALQDTRNDIQSASDNNLLILARRASIAFPTIESATQEEIDSLISDHDFSEINLVNREGIVVASSDPAIVGYDMASGEQSAQFLTLITEGGAPYMVQQYQPVSRDSSQWRKYAAVRIQGGFVQVGFDPQDFMADLSGRIETSVANRHVGQEGSLVVIAPNETLVATRKDLVLAEKDTAALLKDCAGIKEEELYSCTFLGTPCYASYCNVDGFRIFALQPQQEVDDARDLTVLIMSYMEVLMFGAIFVAVYLLVYTEVVKSIREVNKTLGRITHGDLNAEVSVSSNAEFISLSDDINAMVASAREAIANEAARIDQELDYARAIQESALPRTFPPFPEVTAFDIYAQMDPAREVGGDFYDFFLIDDHTLGFVVADVSGKGIPASLFMMAAKAEISNYMLTGMPLSHAIQTANWHLCQGNEANMFVTVWAATLDYDTGVLTYVNAGHNPPLLRRNGEWQWLRARGGLFLGSFETARFRSETLTLEQGDMLLAYTDGVNEAFSAEGEQYGDDRLEAFLANHASLHPRPMVDALHADLARWATGAEQSDDITILALEYGVSPQATGKLTVPATIDQLGTVLDYVRGVLHGRSCPITIQNQIDIILEELFVNICHYAYQDAEEPGFATVEYIYNANPNALTVSLTDSGVPFDPLLHGNPEKPTSIDDAKIGGLGIFMVKRMADDLSYLRDGDQNVVVFVKGW